MGFSRQEYWSRLPLPSPGDLPNLRIKLGSPALQTDSLPIELQGNPMYVITYRKRTDSEFTTEMLWRKRQRLSGIAWRRTQAQPTWPAACGQYHIEVLRFRDTGKTAAIPECPPLGGCQSDSDRVESRNGTAGPRTHGASAQTPEKLSHHLLQQQCILFTQRPPVI